MKIEAPKLPEEIDSLAEANLCEVSAANQTALYELISQAHPLISNPLPQEQKLVTVQAHQLLADPQPQVSQELSLSSAHKLVTLQAQQSGAVQLVTSVESGSRAQAIFLQDPQNFQILPQDYQQVSFF